MEQNNRIGMLALAAIHNGQPLEAMRHLIGIFADPERLADCLYTDGFHDIDEWARVAKRINCDKVVGELLDMPEILPTRADMKILIAAMRDHLHLFGEVRFSLNCKERIEACIDFANTILKRRCEEDANKEEAKHIEKEFARSVPHRKAISKYTR